MSDYPEHVDQIQEQDSEITRLRDLVAVYENTVKFSDAELTRLRASHAELLVACENALHVLTPARPKMDGLDRTRMWLREVIAHAQEVPP